MMGVLDEWLHLHVNMPSDPEDAKLQSFCGWLLRPAGYQSDAALGGSLHDFVFWPRS